ncbi:MAG: (2Fe-2S)-binding protein [Nitrososphaerota archaeon]|nr:(2Fe-2S)-binding protein [Candidatus Bathyarchaeota archaeon]MDW8023513.1 (2Fe-2S)-binding protein [Nitrososphaerota archaeon]
MSETESEKAMARQDVVQERVIADCSRNFGLRPVNLKVNGKLYRVYAEPNWTLQQVLRDELGFTSVKDMCLGHGACGSCTVIVDGRPVLSCLTLAIECDGKEIETVEGVAEKKHPLIEAFLRNHSFQCGYCTPGFVLTAKALLDRERNPTTEDIVEALSGNICRCGVYPAVINAVLEAAEKLKGGEKHG